MIFLNPKIQRVVIFLVVLIIKGYFLQSVYKHGRFQNFEIFPKDMIIDGDDHHNLMIAKNLLVHFTYSDSNSTVPSEYAVWRPPLWPLMLSILLLISNKLFLTLVLKVLLETLFITWLFNKLCKKGILNFLWILPVLLLEPQYQKYSTTFLSESVSAVLLLWILYLFLQLNFKKRTHTLIPIALAAMVMCHPVSIFFVATLFFFYAVFALRTHFKTIVIHTIVLVALIMVWPIRNHITFHQGMFITTSQGTTLSKGWNDKVSQDFNNVNGDLADTNLNLRYMSQDEIKRARGAIAQSKLYKEATKRFFNQLTWQEKLTIARTKLTSNFNPFPEIEKKGLLEKLAIPFRVLYVILFIQSLVYVLRRREFNWKNVKNRIAYFVLAIIAGQSIIAVFAYTGLRFNAIYSLVLLMSFIVFNMDLFDTLVLRKKAKQE